MGTAQKVRERIVAVLRERGAAILFDVVSNPEFLYPGCGYGGFCFPKDVRALEYSARQHRYEVPLIAAVEGVNNRQKQVLERKVVAELCEDLKGLGVALWALAFKPNTDEMRETLSRVLMEGLWHRGSQVQAYGPCRHGRNPTHLWRNGLSATLRRPLRCLPVRRRTGHLHGMVGASQLRFQPPQGVLRRPLIINVRNFYDPGSPDLHIMASGNRYIDKGLDGATSSVRFLLPFTSCIFGMGWQASSTSFRSRIAGNQELPTRWS